MGFWLYQYQSGKLNTGSRAQSFLRAFAFSFAVALLFLNLPAVAWYGTWVSWVNDSICQKDLVGYLMLLNVLNGSVGEPCWRGVWVTLQLQKSSFTGLIEFTSLDAWGLKAPSFVCLERLCSNTFLSLPRVYYNTYFVHLFRLSLATLKHVVIEFMKLNDPSNILLQSLFCVLLSDNTTHSQEFSVSATWAWILAIRQRRITAYVEFGPRLPKECWGRAGERNNVTIWCMCYSYHDPVCRVTAYGMTKSGRATLLTGFVIFKWYLIFKILLAWLLYYLIEFVTVT